MVPPGYKVLSYPQSDGHVGGGLTFIMKDDLKVTDPSQNTFSTHKSLQTPDLIIEDRNENLLYNPERGHQFSDHNFIHSTLDVRKEVPPKKTITYRNLKSIATSKN